MTSSAVPAERRADPEWSQGDRFRKVRTDAGYTQRDFADLLGVKAPTYAAWEADRTTCPRITTVAKRVEVLTGVRAAWVLGVAEPVGPPPVPAPQSSPGESTISGSNSAATSGVVIEGPWSAPGVDEPARRSA